MSEYTLAVRRRAVRLVGFDGSSAEATLFLRATSARGPREESLHERLNALDGEFLACESGDQIALINLAWIAYVECAAEPGEEAEPAMRRTRAELDLVTGESLAGELVYSARPGRARVSDLLNSTSDRFVRLDGDFQRYVRRGAILRVRS
jgi:hypothetical protein